MEYFTDGWAGRQAQTWVTLCWIPGARSATSYRRGVGTGSSARRGAKSLNIWLKQKVLTMGFLRRFRKSLYRLQWKPTSSNLHQLKYQCNEQITFHFKAQVISRLHGFLLQVMLSTSLEKPQSEIGRVLPSESAQDLLRVLVPLSHVVVHVLQSPRVSSYRGKRFVCWLEL